MVVSKLAVEKSAGCEVIHVTWLTPLEITRFLAFSFIHVRLLTDPRDIAHALT